MSSQPVPRRESATVSGSARPQAVRPAAPFSERDFAILGGGQLAYVRQARSEDVAFLCPDAPLLSAGHAVFVLHAADGSAIVVTETREAAVANAALEQLETVSLH